MAPPVLAVTLSLRDVPVFMKLCRVAARALEELAQHDPATAATLRSEIETELREAPG